MLCRRCKSDMVNEIFFDSFDGTQNHHFFGYRCIFCGNIEDPLISENRHKHLIQEQKTIIKQSAKAPGPKIS
jgi:hypothetical protein